MKTVVVAKVLGPHSLKGGLKIKSFTEHPETLLTFQSFLDDTGKTYTVCKHQKLSSGDVFIMYMEGIETRTQAEALGKPLLSVPLSSLPTVEEEDVFYYEQLKELDVIGPDQQLLGTVIAVHNFGAGDILEIAHPEGSWMVRFAKPFVEDVCLKEKVVRLGKMPE